MTLQSRAVLKRIATMLCSMGTIVSYGYLIGGAGGYLMGRGRPFVALTGFVVGSLLAFVAIKIWRSYLEDVDALNETEPYKPEEYEDDERYL